MTSITPTCIIAVFIAIIATTLVMYIFLKNPFKSGFTSLVLLLATLIGTAFGFICSSHVEIQALLGGVFTFDSQYQPLNQSFSIEAFKISLISIIGGMIICLIGILGGTYLEQRKASG
jgi:hypothetical protein